MNELAKISPASVQPWTQDDGERDLFWVTRKLLRKFGFSVVENGDAIAIIIVSNDRLVQSRIETFLYDSNRVYAWSNGQEDNLGRHASGKAYSLELYHQRKSYAPVYGMVPPNLDPYEMARRYLTSLTDLIELAGISAPKLKEGLSLLEG